MEAPRRERRHHRKTAATAAVGVDVGGGGAAATRASYGDVFGGPPRFATPFGGAPPLDYAEVFGGVTACSIPYLDLPPVAVGGCGDGGFFGRGAGVGDYGEIFGRFDFGVFAVPYEELFGDAAEAQGGREKEEKEEEEEIASSSSGASRSSMKKESRQLDTEPSTIHQHFKEHVSSPVSFPPDSQEFVMSNYKATQAKPDDLVDMPTCTVDPSMDRAVASVNSSYVPTANPASKMDNDIVVNGGKGKKPPSTSVTTNVSPENDFIVDHKEHIPERPPFHRNVSANGNSQKSDSHSTYTNGKPSADYAFLRVSDVNVHVQTQPEVLAPPLRQQPKMLKRESAAKGDLHLANQSSTPTSSVQTTLTTNMPQAERRADPTLSNTEPNPSSAAAAMKEAMEYAEARLRAAKELMERKGDSFKIRKKPHHRSTRSTEIKAPVQIEKDTFEENLSVKKPAKEEKNSENSVLDKHQKASSIRLDHYDDNFKLVLPSEKPQQKMQPCTVPYQTSGQVEKLDNWRSGDEFYELTGDDQTCKTDVATGKEENFERSKLVTEYSRGQKSRIEVTAADSDLERYEKLWEVSDGRDVGVKHVDQIDEKIVSIEKDSVSVILEASTENMEREEIQNSHFERRVTAGNPKECHDDNGNVELPSTSENSSEPGFINNIPSSFSDDDIRDLGSSGTRGDSVAGTSQEPENSKGGVEAVCDDEMPCTSGNEKSQESPDGASVCNSQANKIKSLILEELEGSNVSEAFPRVQCTAEVEAETYGREKFSFTGEQFLHNENVKTVEVPYEALISEAVKVGAEVEVGPFVNSDESVPDLDVECPAESNITSQSNDLVNHEESTMLDVFEVASKLIKRDLDQGIHGPVVPAEVENRTEGIDGIISDGKGKKVVETPLENSKKTNTEEGSGLDQEDQTSSEADAKKGQSDVDEHGNLTIGEMGSGIRSADKVTIEIANDCSTRSTVDTNDEPASCPETCTGMQHLPQNAESATSQTASSKNVPCVDKTEEVCKEAERELPTECSTSFEKDKSRGSKMEGKAVRETTSKAEQKHQEPLLGKSVSQPKSAERPIPNSVSEVSRKEVHGVQRTKERGSEASRRLEEAKERVSTKEDSERKKMEEEERAREREKDKLAVERATREAHERAFAEAREKAEKMAMERITAARQRASAEARLKEERARAEARIKAERAAVERATAEARERAIEKAKAEKEARERREQYRSSSKESSKSTNLGIRQETQYQRPTSSSRVVAEAESALRHKARIERHQRTAERVTKALAEKNMRDLMAQREQAEKHRLADFLDPEVRRWSNGKEGNLRALLSTLQYILGADSGWQPVPLTDLITAAAVKKAYRKATLCVHPDKLQQRGATIRQKYICEKVFDLLKDAWNKFTSEER